MVKVFILGTSPEATGIFRYIEAESQEEAEYEATHGLAGEGWGVIESYEA